MRGYGYNAAGDMTTITSTSSSRSLAYSAEGRLERFTRVANGVTLTADYAYDPFNRRIRKEVDENNDGTAEDVIFFHYSDEGLIAEYDESGNLLRGYGWQPGGLWGTDPVFYRNPVGSTVTYGYYLNDHLGTPHAVIDAGGSILWSADYDTFGRAYAYSISTLTQPLRFPGQYEDPESGLHYNWHRYYLPDAGRYNRVDPMKDGRNWTIYTRSNTVNFLDELGLALKKSGECKAPICKNGREAALHRYYEHYIRVGDPIGATSWQVMRASYLLSYLPIRVPGVRGVNARGIEELSHAALAGVVVVGRLAVRKQCMIRTYIWECWGCADYISCGEKTNICYYTKPFVQFNIAYLE